MMQTILTEKEAKNKNIEEVFDQLGTQTTGLTSSEAQERLETFGPNEIVEKKKNPFLKFLDNFWGPIPWMIEIAAILSLIIMHWDDFFVIILMLLINAIVRFWEEYKADNAVELLKEKLALHAKVLRDGKWIEVLARDLVPGDVIRVRLGDIIPADIKLFDGNYLSLDQSALTGESLPVEKGEHDIAYSGAIVKRGEMNGVIIGTGINTMFGRTTSLVSEAKVESHFQKAVVNIGNYLIVLAIALVSIIFVVGLIRSESFIILLQFTLVLVIAAIPVALPAVLMVSMAIGAAELARNKAIAKRLLSIEELASMDILCSDKTGTITKNEISIGEIIPLGEFSEKEVIEYGVLASKLEDKDPIDNAFFTKFEEIGGDTSGYEVLKFLPFDPVIKRTEAHVKSENSEMKVAKGAIQTILSLVHSKEEVEEIVNEQGLLFAEQGYRALGVAKTDSEGKWYYVGLVALFDPAREDSCDVIKEAVTMGVDVKMVTGDHSAIAKQMSTKLGMGTNCVSASILLECDEVEGARLVEEANVFAEVYPEHKYNIVKDLQQKDHIVGMTGDGVNDAPALNRADVGIAVSNANDAAKSAADIVLTEPGLSVIVKATELARVIFERMKSYATYRIAETVRVLIFLVLAIVIFNFYPITAIMIVILALLNDLPIMTIAFDNARPAPKPVRWKMERVLSVASVLGILGVMFSFSLFLIGKFAFNLGFDTIQTLIFLKLAVAGHMTIYLTRSEGDHFWSKPYPAPVLLIVCEGTQVVATIFAATGVFMSPIGWALALFVWGFSFLELFVVNFLKVYFIRWLNRKKWKGSKNIPSIKQESIILN
ncbi:MAG: plasma-membrane proton-efflux P-type ATPase [Candidatus Lokiarchaeota archaeon]